MTPNKSPENTLCAYKGCVKMSEVVLSLPLGVSMQFCRDCADKLLASTLVSNATDVEAREYERGDIRKSTEKVTTPSSVSATHPI